MPTTGQDKRYGRRSVCNILVPGIDFKKMPGFPYGIL
jgi:hypothetical protein